MTRYLATALLSSLIAVTLGACGNNDGGAYSGGGGGGYTAMCSAYTTCGSCTPVDGCGWCFSGASGACAPDPDSCTSATEFTWTWDPSGCPDVAVVVPQDAGQDAGTDALPEASSPAEATAPLDARSETASD
jgi:hypothetical protein